MLLCNSLWVVLMLILLVVCDWVCDEVLDVCYEYDAFVVAADVIVIVVVVVVDADAAVAVVDSKWRAIHSLHPSISFVQVGVCKGEIKISS